MSKSYPMKSRILISAILFLCALPGISQDQASKPYNVLTSAHDFLQVSYPELFGRNLVLTLGVTQGMDGTWQQVNEMQFDVKPYDPRSERILNPPFDAKTGKQLAPPKNPALLQGSISFNHEGKLQQFSVADCDLAHSKQNETIQELVGIAPRVVGSTGVCCPKKGGRSLHPWEERRVS